MNKEELLQELEKGINAGEISREELISRLSLTPSAGREISATPKDSTHFSMTKMLYVLGAAIVVIGIIIFVYQVWDDLGSLGRISVTLGLGLLFTVIGSVLLKSKPENQTMVSVWPIAITFGAIFVFYLLLNFAHRSSVLTFFAIANGTAFIYLLVEAMIDGPFYRHEDLYAYLTMVVGASYLLLAHAFRGGWNNKLVGILYFFGSDGFLGAAFSRVFDSVPWQMVYFLLVIGGLFLSAYTKSRAILVVSTCFLLAHVSYITGEYFADSVGWPVALVILGFIFIGLGYVSININKKYIAK